MDVLHPSAGIAHRLVQEFSLTDEPTEFISYSVPGRVLERDVNGEPVRWARDQHEMKPWRRMSRPSTKTPAQKEAHERVSFGDILIKHRPRLSTSHPGAIARKVVIPSLSGCILIHDKQAGPTGHSVYKVRCLGPKCDNKDKWVVRQMLRSASCPQCSVWWRRESKGLRHGPVNAGLTTPELDSWRQRLAAGVSGDVGEPAEPASPLRQGCEASEVGQDVHDSSVDELSAAPEEPSLLEIVIHIPYAAGT